MIPALRLQRALRLWAVLGLAAFALLPWYFLQDRSLLSALSEVWQGPDAGSALVQAISYGRPWLWSGAAGLLLCLLPLSLPMSAHAQGRWLTGGALLGLLGLLLSGFAIGAAGWSFDVLEQALGTLPTGQYGVGWGAALVLLALLVLLGAGVARLGAFRGDVFVAASVVLCLALLALFVVYPVLRSLASAWVDDLGGHAWSNLLERLATERVWSLGCLAGSRCGVAWNTLGLALATALGTTFMGLLLALWAERGQTRLAGPLNVLAMLPIITPPFVVGLGLILLFGRAGVVNQFLEYAFGITPTRWFYGMSPAWTVALLANADMMVGNDSGMTHVAGLVGVPTRAVMTHLTPEFVFADAPSVEGITAEGWSCQGCAWQPARGYRPECPRGCKALASIGVDRVLAGLEEAGYAVWPLVVGAVHVGAPHRRNRVWIVAADLSRVGRGPGAERRPDTGASGQPEQALQDASLFADLAGDGGAPADADEARRTDGCLEPGLRPAQDADDRRAFAQAWPDWNGGFAGFGRVDARLSAGLAEFCRNQCGVEGWEGQPSKADSELVSAAAQYSSDAGSASDWRTDRALRSGDIAPSDVLASLTSLTSPPIGSAPNGFAGPPAKFAGQPTGSTPTTSTATCRTTGQRTSKPCAGHVTCAITGKRVAQACASLGEQSPAYRRAARQCIAAYGDAVVPQIPEAIGRVMRRLMACSPSP